MSDNNSSAGCVTIPGGLLQIVFIILKLTDVIHWPWPVVLIPMWVDLGFMAIILVAIIIMLLASDS